MFPIFGTGVGSHADVYRLAYPYASRVEYTHAESGYLNLLTETGLAGIGLLVVAILFFGHWSSSVFRGASFNRKGLMLVAVAGIAVSLTHSVFDFPWYLTSCLSIAVALAAAACRLAALESPPVRQQLMSMVELRALVGFGGLGTLLAIGCLIGPAIGGFHFNNYLNISLRARHDHQLKTAVALTNPQQFEKQQQRSYERNRTMVECLQAALRWDAHHPRANLRLAALYLKSFEFLQQNNANAFGLSQIRDAALASDFDSETQLVNWLEFGRGAKSQFVVRRAGSFVSWLGASAPPGRGYIACADLAFLSVTPDEETDKLLQQAVAVRPYDAAVLFTLGREAAMSGDAAQALEHWKRSFALDDEYRDAIIRAIAPQIPAEMFVEYFQPEARELARIFRFYRDNQLERHMQALAPALLQKIEEDSKRLNGEQAARRLLEAVAVCQDIKDVEGAIQRAILAAERAPNFYNVRKVLGQQLIAANRFDESIEQLRWCIRRRPSDQQVKELLVAVQQMQRQQNAARGSQSFKNRRPPCVA